MAGGHTGHVVRAWLPDTREWSIPYTLRTTDYLRANVPADLPTGATKPEDPKK